MTLLQEGFAISDLFITRFHCTTCIAYVSKHDYFEAVDFSECRSEEVKVFCFHSQISARLLEMIQNQSFIENLLSSELILLRSLIRELSICMYMKASCY